MNSKGNRLNSEGIFFGCGGQTLDGNDQKKSITSISSLKIVENSDLFGLYTNVNGSETKVSESTCIQPGDTVGVRFDSIEGTISFDLNGVDFGVAYHHSRLDGAAPMFFPTVDLGMGGDSVELVDLPDWATHDIQDTSLSTSCLP